MAWGVTFRQVLCKGSLAEKGCGTRKVSGPGERDVASRVARSPRARCSTVRRRSVVLPCACSALGLSLFHVLLFRRAQKPVIPAALLSLPGCPFPQVKSFLGWFPTPVLFLPCVLARAGGYMDGRILPQRIAWQHVMAFGGSCCSGSPSGHCSTLPSVL